jgi:hypothetical protein
MEVDVSVEFFKEPYPVANQYRQDRITNLVDQPETQAFARNCTASNKPDGTERAPQVPHSRTAQDRLNRTQRYPGFAADRDW